MALGVTCYFVSDELGRLHLAHAAEEAAQLVLAHALRQVVDDQVGPGLVVLHQLLRKAVIVQILAGRRGGCEFIVTFCFYRHLHYIHTGDTKLHVKTQLPNLPQMAPPTINQSHYYQTVWLKCLAQAHKRLVGGGT